jgi:hypothetical protein
MTPDHPLLAPASVCGNGREWPVPEGPRVGSEEAWL